MLFISKESNGENYLPYLETTLPQERPGTVTITPSSKRVVECKLASVERPRSSSPRNPGKLEDLKKQTEQQPPVPPIKVKLPRQDSKAMARSQQKPWEEFASQALQSPRQARKATSQQQEPKPSTSSWVNCDELPSAPKPIKRYDSNESSTDSSSSSTATFSKSSKSSVSSKSSRSSTSSSSSESPPPPPPPSQRPTGAVSKTRPATARPATAKKPTIPQKPAVPAKAGMRQTAPPSQQQRQPSAPQQRPSGPQTRPSGPQTRPQVPQQRPQAPQQRPPAPTTKPSAKPPVPSGKPRPPSATSKPAKPPVPKRMDSKSK